MSTLTREKQDEILNFWFGELEYADELPKEKMPQWFKKDESFDRLIFEKFENDLMNAIDNKYTSWTKTPRGRLALIILLDQFPRNMFRNTPQAFSCDPLALKYAIEGIEKGDDYDLMPIEKAFFYMPLQHSENLEIQKCSLSLFDILRRQAPEPTKSYFETTYEYALRHFEIVEKFGRFPHRNAILGRNSTEAEEDFLREPNSSF